MDVASSNGVHQLVAAVLRLEGIPVVEDRPRARIETLPPVCRHLIEPAFEDVAVVRIPGFDLCFGARGLSPFPRGLDLRLGPGAVRPRGVRDLGEVALPRGRDHGELGRVERRERIGLEEGRGAVEAVRPKSIEEGEVESRDARVVELRGHRREDRHRVWAGGEVASVALHLLLDVAEGVFGAALLKLVERHEIGHVEHPDLFELGRCAELGRHDVERDVDQIGDFGVALADASGLQNHQVEAGGAADLDGVLKRPRGRAVRLTRRERAHIDAAGVLAVERVHADPVAQERAARPSPRRIHRQDGDLEVGEVVQEAADELVGQRRLARAAGARDAHNRRGVVHPRGQRRHRGGAVAARGCRALLDRRQRTCDGLNIGGRRDLDFGAVGPPPVPRHLEWIEVAGSHHRLDHALEAHTHSVLGRENLGHAVGLEVGDLLGDDHAAAAAVHLDVAGAALAEKVHHVLEVLDVAALVARDRDALRVLLDGRPHDVVHGAVVAEVDHLDALRLQDAPHDVDCGVVAVEQAGGRHEADGVLGGVGHNGRASGNELQGTGSTSALR